MKSINFGSALGELDKNSDMIREYWRDLRANWQASENSLRRTLFYLLALAITFLLLSTKALDEVTLFGLTITNLRLVATLIPAVIAYLIYVISVGAAITLRLGDIHDSLAQHYWPKFYQENLEMGVRPVGSLTETALIALSIENSVLRNAAAMGGFIRFTIYMTAPISFEVYALWRLISRNEGALWLECLVASFFFLMILASTPNYIYIVKYNIEDFPRINK